MYFKNTTKLPFCSIWNANGTLLAVKLPLISYLVAMETYIYVIYIRSQTLRQDFVQPISVAQFLGKSAAQLSEKLAGLVGEWHILIK